LSRIVYAIIVVYNGLPWLEKCIGGLLTSTIHVSVIVVDNGSADGSVDFITTHFKDITFIKSKENLGFGRANNIGIKKAYELGADFVFLLNQDAWVEAKTIQILVDSLSNNKDYGIVSPMHLNGNGNALDDGFSSYIIPEKCKGLYSDLYLKSVQKDIYEATFINAAAWLISRDCIEIVGGFSPAFFHYAEDVNYVDRLKFYSLKIGVCPNCQINHDRENRKKSEFTVEKKLLENQLFLHYLNPNLENSIEKDLNYLKTNYFKRLLFLRFKDAERILLKIKFLKSNSDMLVSVLKESLNNKLAFINRND